MSNEKHSSLDNEVLEKKIRSLDLALKSEKEKTNEARRQAEVLYAHILAHRPIRKQVKVLLRSIDESMRIRIDELNVAKRKHASRLIPINIDHAKEYSRDELLSLVRKNDVDNFYSNGHSKGYKKNYAYKISSFSYGTSRKIAKKTFHVMKKTRNRARRNK